MFNLTCTARGIPLPELYNVSYSRLGEDPWFLTVGKKHSGYSLFAETTEVSANAIVKHL